MKKCIKFLIKLVSISIVLYLTFTLTFFLGGIAVTVESLKFIATHDYRLMCYGILLVNCVVLYLVFHFIESNKIINIIFVFVVLGFTLMCVQIIRGSARFLIFDILLIEMGTIDLAIPIKEDAEKKWQKLINKGKEQ